jgi:hypothetical protein
MALEDIGKEIDENGGVLSTPMWRIRNAYGAERLGVNVCSNISEELELMGIAHIPLRLPADQNALVRVYRKKSATGRLIRAGQKIGEEYDRQLREAAAGEAQSILRQIRELVCD